jgi:hypothetical protein
MESAFCARIMKNIKIKLLPPDAKRIAIAILDGELPPETNNIEVINELADMAIFSAVEVSFYREEGEGKVVFSPKEALAAVMREIEIRPISQP